MSVHRALQIARRQAGGSADDKDIDPVVSMGGHEPRPPTSPVEAARSIARTVAPNIYEAVAGEDKPIAPLPEQGKVPSTSRDYGPAAIEGLGFLPGPEAALGKAGMAAAAGLLPRAAKAVEEVAPGVTRRTFRKSPGVGGLENPMPFPEDIDARLARKLARGPDVGAPKNAAAVEFEPGIFVGNVTPEQWIKRTEKVLRPGEIDAARKWYADAIHTYEGYFGKEKGASMLGAWLIANQNATPGFAQLSATRALEQYLNKTAQFGPQKQAGLAHDRLIGYWDSILSHDPSKMPRSGGQKIYDFVDSALQKNTRTFYGDDPRAGKPAVADVHSLRDMGFIDEPLEAWVKNKYGSLRGLQLDSYQGSPGEQKYEWAADKMRRFTDYLNQNKYRGGNWSPLEFQAVGWTAMSKMLGRQAQTAEEAVSSNVRNLSYELDFGAGAPYSKQFGEWAGLSSDQKKSVTDAILPMITDFASKETGAHVWQQASGLGGWHQFTNPSYKARLVASPEVAGDMANMIGYLAQQTKVFGYRPENTGSRLGVALYGKGLGDPAKVDALWQSLVKEHPEFAAGFSPSVDDQGRPGIEILLDKGGKKMAENVEGVLIPALERLTQKHGIGDADVHGFKAAENSAEHNWEADPAGSSYLERLGKRYGPDIQKRLELFKRQTLEPALRKEISRQKAEGIAPRASGGRISAALVKARAAGGSAMSKVDRALRIAKQHGGPAALPLSGFPGAQAAGQAYAGPIRSHVPGRTDRHEMDVEPGSYVVPADVVSIVGQGNTEAGNNIWKLIMAQPVKGHPGIGASLQHMPPLQLGHPKLMKHAEHIKVPGQHGQGQSGDTGGGRENEARDNGLVPIIAAGGEIVLPPGAIERKWGDLDHGHVTLDLIVKKIREAEIKRLKTAPPPKK